MLAAVKKYADELIWGPEELPKMEEKVPDEQFLQRIEAERDRSPDLTKLQSRKYRAFFIYDTLMKGRKDFHLIEPFILQTDPEGDSTVYNAYTNDRFEVWQRTRDDGYSFPVALRTGSPTAKNDFSQKGGNSVGSARVKGKLYLIDTSVINSLDNIKANRLVFERELVDVLIPYKTRTIHKESLKSIHISDELPQIVRAQMYVGINEHWEPMLDGGYEFQPVQLFRPNQAKVWNPEHEPYYYFLK